MESNRREFLTEAAGCALGLGLFGSLADAKQPDGKTRGTVPVSGRRSPAENRDSPLDAATVPIVDTHQHLWDLGKFQLPWLKTAGALNRTFAVKEYREATARLNVVKAVYMEVDMPPEQQVAEAQYVIELCRSGVLPTCAAVIGGRPGSEGFAAYISRFKGTPYIKGVRHVLFDSPAEKPSFLEPAFVNSMRLLGELGLSFDLCLPANMLAAGGELADRCRGTRFILDHCGNADVKTFRAARGGSSAAARQQADQWRRDIAKLAGRKNVVCKISGIIASVPPRGWDAGDLAPIVNHCLDSFGPDRVMFGSDWPMCTQQADFQRWVETLLEVIRNRSRQDQLKLLAGNAVRFYSLDRA
jgi:L-fuconolactonase